jgi:hypothetical protein
VEYYPIVVALSYEFYKILSRFWSFLREGKFDLSEIRREDNDRVYGHNDRLNICPQCRENGGDVKMRLERILLSSEALSDTESTQIASVNSVLFLPPKIYMVGSDLI